MLQETTHLLENLLDGARRQEMSLSTEIINLFLETKDIMQEQLDAYKTSQQPDAESFEYICQARASWRWRRNSSRRRLRLNRPFSSLS